MENKDQIASLAYELYVQSGRVEGRDVDNWLEAERILRSKQRLAAPQVKPAPTGKKMNTPFNGKNSLTTKTKKKGK